MKISSIFIILLKKTENYKISTRFLPFFVLLTADFPVLLIRYAYNFRNLTSFLMRIFQKKTEFLLKLEFFQKFRRIIPVFLNNFHFFPF